MGLDLLTLAFERPAIDWHAFAPELVLLAAGCLITLVDIVFLEKARPYTAALAGTPCLHDPYDHVIVPGFVRRDALPAIHDTYPDIRSPGSFPY